jgi:hypothetical protein
MKNVLMIPLCCLTIWAFSKQSVQFSDTEGKSVVKNNLISQTDTNRIQINANFPFGCNDLTKFIYPKYWEGDIENYGHLKEPNNQDFDNIEQCFNEINLAKTIAPPRPESFDLIEIGDNFKNANNLDTSMQKSIDSCRYRLPNIGIYECYYSYAHYGNLLLLDTNTNRGKLLNIYANDLGDDAQTNLRYFYIEKNVINIYEAYYYDDGCSLHEAFKIVVKTDGEIIIHQI